MNLTADSGSTATEMDFQHSDYVVEDIFYHNQPVRVYDAAVFGITIDYPNGSLRVSGDVPTDDGGSLPVIRNTTFPTPQFSFASLTTRLHILRNCTRLGRSVICNTANPRPLAIFGDQGDDLRDALENCFTHFVAPVEDTSNNVLVALRSRVLLNWTATDCRVCENSGGRCSFENGFRCFCPDRPYSVLCVPIARKSNITVPLITGIAATLAITTLLVTFIFIRKRKIEKAQNQKDFELFLKKHTNLAPKRFEYKKLKKITNSFSDSLGK